MRPGPPSTRSGPPKIRLPSRWRTTEEPTTTATEEETTFPSTFENFDLPTDDSVAEETVGWAVEPVEHVPTDSGWTDFDDKSSWKTVGSTDIKELETEVTVAKQEATEATSTTERTTTRARITTTRATRSSTVKMTTTERTFDERVHDA